MINEHMKKIAFAEGYHTGMIGEMFDNPYEDIELRIQFNYGFRMATDRIDSLAQQAEVIL
jgi:ribosome modulation factor